MRVKLIKGARNVITDEYLLTFSLISPIGEEAIASLRFGNEYSLDGVYESKRRSLDANAYFHCLVGKIADSVGESKAYIKNWLLSQYGQPEIIDGEMVTIKSKVEPTKMMERDDIHLAPCGYEFDIEGETWTIYRVMKPTHTYHSKEFSVLIDRVVEEAKGLGIETLSPAELERMMRAWKV